MLQQIEIVHDGSNLRLKSEQIDQIYGKIFQNENFDIEQTFNLRIQKSNSYRDQYIQNGFLNHLPINNSEKNKLDSKKIKNLFKVFYFYYRKHKLKLCQIQLSQPTFTPQLNHNNHSIRYQVSHNSQTFETQLIKMIIDLNQVNQSIFSKASLRSRHIMQQDNSNFYSSYFSLKLPISQNKQKCLNSKSYTPYYHHLKILQININLILFQSTFKSAIKKVKQVETLIKIRGQYYKIFFYEISSNELIQYKDLSNNFQKSLKFKESNFINFQTNEQILNSLPILHRFSQWRDSIPFRELLGVKSNEDIQNDCEYQTLQDQSYYRQIRSRLINTKRERNIINSSCDSFLININLKQMRNVYHSEDKHSLIKNVAETSLDNIKYENNNLKVNISKIIPEKLKFSSKPRFQACQKILKQKAQVEVLYKTIQRFENQNYLLQIQFVIEQARSIIPLEKDNHFGLFKQNLKFQPSI
ncbi:unnamed protein product [Paramecium primaurelia]|uniref:Uncharacterized protein n=1 Tax=Paramecium primaurelia TaxID=5886 RepID=A0A8S1QLS1_PARPR|nr:unnamed protein product [Paramecium primaurelia]